MQRQPQPLGCIESHQIRPVSNAGVKMQFSPGIGDPITQTSQLDLDHGSEQALIDTGAMTEETNDPCRSENRSKVDLTRLRSRAVHS
jgi:hypothetical protein